MKPATKYLNPLLHLFYPHTCEGCGTDILSRYQFLCARCLHQLPETYFFEHPSNPVEKLFYGRLPIYHAGAAFYFTKHSLLQHLLVELKYKANKEAGYFLGRMLGHHLKKIEHYDNIDLLIPLPLHPRKEHSRGYNQAQLICQGINEVWKKPVIENAVVRARFSETQTHQNRLSRWQNMEGIFTLGNPEPLINRHILLIDDVITTGATLEACGSVILSAPGASLSIAAVAYTL